jgi:hypothetical protein
MTINRYCQHKAADRRLYGFYDNLVYQAGLIKQESTSELLRFTIRHILNQVHTQPEYLILKQQQGCISTLLNGLIIIIILSYIDSLGLISIEYGNCILSETIACIIYIFLRKNKRTS